MARIGRLGNARLAGDARSAIRKLAVDLPIDPAAGSDVRDIMPRRASVDPAVFDAVAGAVERRKTLTFDYRSMDRDSTDRRTLHPYGLFFLGAHWYLTGFDVDRGALRNFRLSRVRKARANAKQPGTPDFDVPAAFELRQHARSAEAWELGDGDAVEVVVRFAGSSGYVDAARSLGKPDESAGCRRFHVRRRDAFVRWLMTFGGDAIPVSPAEVVEAFRDQVRATAAVYA
jgi:proteasome accessory factor B